MDLQQISLTKTYFSRSNTILSKHSDVWLGSSKQTDKRSKQLTPRRLEELEMDSDKEDAGGYDTDLDEQRERTVMEGSTAQKCYMKACRKLGIIPIEALFVAMEKTSSTLANRFRNENEVLSFAIGLSLSTSLVEINLLDNNFNTKMIVYICSAIWENVHLSCLALCGNKMNVQSMRAVEDLLIETKHLTSVDLSNNDLREIHHEILSSIIQNNRSIIRLDLSHNFLDDKCMQTFARAIGDNENIRFLNLSWNCIRTPGIELLCKYLKNNNTLRELKLRMNGAGEVGAGHLARLLTLNTRLHHLDVSQNRINDKGYGYFAKMFIKNKTLKELIIGHNPVSTAGVKVLLNTLGQNPNDTLEYIELDGIYVNKETENTMDTLRTLMPRLSIAVHGVVKKGTELKDRDQVQGVIDLEPMEVMRFYIEKTGSRLVDVFKILDPNRTNAVTRNDFVRGLQQMNLPLTGAQVDSIMEQLDSSKTGTINFGQFMEGDKDARMRIRKRKESQKRKSTIRRVDFDDI